MEAAKTKILPASIYYLSEQSVTVEFGTVISQDLLGKISSFSNFIQTHPFPGFTTIISAYTSLTVIFDPVQVIKSTLPGITCFEKVSGYLTDLNPIAEKANKAGNEIVIPVCYGAAFGPDLEEVAQLHQLSTDEVIALHSRVTYPVYMIGFVPGFAYLGGMDDLLATPRKANPRKAVPAGSIGIAGQQTGIYPLQTPGGWQIIGQTPLKMFDVCRDQPSLLKAGDRVKFKPIDLEEFSAIKAGQ